MSINYCLKLKPGCPQSDVTHLSVSRECAACDARLTHRLNSSPAFHSNYFASPKVQSHNTPRKYILKTLNFVYPPQFCGCRLLTPKQVVRLASYTHFLLKPCILIVSCHHLRCRRPPDPLPPSLPASLRRRRAALAGGASAPGGGGRGGGSGGRGRGRAGGGAG